MAQRILVTGGTGYIGSHTVVELVKAGYEPVIIDNLSNSTSEVLDGIEAISGKRPAFEKFDLLDEKALYAFKEKYADIDAIIHFAASKAVGESVEKPLFYYRNNVGTLLSILNVFGPRIKLVFSSSCTVYGQPDILPVSELAPFKKAESPYGNTKQMCEEIIENVSKRELKAISLRYFNPVGAHESALIGELPLGTPNNLVPFITQTAIGIRERLTVFGNDYNTPDGSCLRDYIHVVDLARAHVLACRRLLDGDAGDAGDAEKGLEVFNLGTGKGSSVLEVIHTFEKVSGVKLNYQIGPRRPGDVEKVYGDVSRASTVLGWVAQLDLDQMMSSAWKWEQHLAAKKNKV